MKAQNYALRVCCKSLASVCHPDRDRQFSLIAELRERATAEGIPIISVDTQKKELIGRFHNAGRKWGQQPEYVNDHDFRSNADGIAVPYGIDDLRHNQGTIYVG